MRSSSGILSVRRRTRCARHHRARSSLGNHRNKKVPPPSRDIKRRSTNHREHATREEKSDEERERQKTRRVRESSVSRDLTLVLVRIGRASGATASSVEYRFLFFSVSNSPKRGKKLLERIKRENCDDLSTLWRSQHRLEKRNKLTKHGLSECVHQRSASKRGKNAGAFRRTRTQKEDLFPLE